MPWQVAQYGKWLEEQRTWAWIIFIRKHQLYPVLVFSQRVKCTQDYTRNIPNSSPISIPYKLVFGISSCPAQERRHRGPRRCRFEVFWVSSFGTRPGPVREAEVFEREGTTIEICENSWSIMILYDTLWYFLDTFLILYDVSWSFVVIYRNAWLLRMSEGCFAHLGSCSFWAPGALVQQLALQGELSHLSRYQQHETANGCADHCWPFQYRQNAVLHNIPLGSTWGDRLRFAKTVGVGPATGWVSICLRDKPLLTLRGEISKEEIQRIEIDSWHLLQKNHETSLFLWRMFADLAASGWIRADPAMERPNGTATKRWTRSRLYTVH